MTQPKKGSSVDTKDGRHFAVVGHSKARNRALYKLMQGQKLRSGAVSYSGKIIEMTAKAYRKLQKK